MSYQTTTDIENLICAFEKRTLPHSQWNHQAHLIVALWYLTRYSEAEAIARIRNGIWSYNRAVGIPNTQNSGYHETLTRFWVEVVRQYLANSPDSSLVELAKELIKRCDHRLPLAYYDREVLMSTEARTRWVEPNLKPQGKKKII